MLGQIVSFLLQYGESMTTAEGQGVIVKVVNSESQIMDITGSASGYDITFTLQSVAYSASPAVGCWSYPS